MPKPILCIVGLGYVGLPLAHAFGVKGYEVWGYDISQKRIDELLAGIDRTRELTEAQLKESNIHFSADPSVMKNADIIILAIPTPVDEANKPDLTLVESASESVGTHLKKGAIVVYESTVYPGVTEDICGPILERASGLICGKDFTLGYSPERINPGDKEHTVSRIVKVVAGQDEKTLNALTELYGSVVTAGIHKASSIKVAEMSKAIENAQRDINIAFVNEIAVLCSAIGIPSSEVFAAAGTKWNFLRFKPGLVGGHCIGVDPYYLVEKAEQLGVKTNVITAGRGINDSMGCFVAEQVIKALPADCKNPKMLVLGATFKEDVPDMRNSKAVDVVRHLESKGATVLVHDSEVETSDLTRMKYTPGTLADGPFDAILLLVPHKEYIGQNAEDYSKALNPRGVFYDLKSIVDKAPLVAAGRVYVSL